LQPEVVVVVVLVTGRLDYLIKITQVLLVLRTVPAAKTKVATVAAAAVAAPGKMAVQAELLQAETPVHILGNTATV
jgi:hypothetical protein